MAKVIPFRGMLYDSAVVKEIAQVVAPPYDVIDAAGQAELHARHPNNVIRLEFGAESRTDASADNRYTRAEGFLGEWVRTGVLRRDQEPTVYLYNIEYRPPYSRPGDATRMLQGFLATTALEEFGTGQIYPHENTRAAAKADRLELLQACRANFSPIFSLYSDPQGTVIDLLKAAVDFHRPRIDFRDDEGFRQRLWAVTDRRVLEQLCQAMAPRPLFIADGHHRYETALTYRRLMRQQGGDGSSNGFQPYDAVLMLLAGIEDSGLTILPTHRVLTKPLPVLAEIRTLLRGVCDLEELPFTATSEPQTRKRFLHTMRERGRQHPVFGLVLGQTDAYFLLALHPVRLAALGTSPRERLDVSILHNEVLQRLGTDTSSEGSIVYTKDDQEAIDLVRRGTHPASLLLNPTKVSEVREVAAAGERMPHKSTYFFPKPLTGLVMNVFEE